MPNEFAVQTKLIGTTINSRISANRNWVYSDWVRTAHYRGFQFDHMALLFEISVSIFWRFVLLNGSVWKEAGARPQGCMGVWVNRTAVGLTTCGGRQEEAGAGRDADYGIGIIATSWCPTRYRDAFIGRGMVPFEYRYAKINIASFHAIAD